MKLYQVTYGHICGGIVVNEDSQCVVETAPALQWMWGKKLPWIGRWLERRQGTVELAGSGEKENSDVPIFLKSR